jgi:hypothetical protein
MPRPVKPTGRFVALLVASVIALPACTSDGGSSGTTAGATAGTVPSGPTFIPTPAETFTGPPGTAVYTYANEGLVVTVDLDGNAGTLTVENGTPHDLQGPDVYVLDAVDGHRIEGDVASSAPVPAGETATFGVSIDGIEDASEIGLLVLVFGADNYGAFVRTG